MFLRLRTRIFHCTYVYIYICTLLLSFLYLLRFYEYYFSSFGFCLPRLAWILSGVRLRGVMHPTSLGVNTLRLTALGLEGFRV